MLNSIVLLILVIIFALVFKLYIFKYQLFRENLSEGFLDDDTTSDPIIGGGFDTFSIYDKITSLEGEISALVDEINAFSDAADAATKSTKEYQDKIAELETRKRRKKEELDGFIEKYKGYILSGKESTTTQINFLKDALGMKTVISDVIAQIDIEEGQATLINTIRNSFDFKINANLVNIKYYKEDDKNEYVCFYITTPGYVLFKCNSSRKAEFALLGGGGAGGGNHGGGGGAGVILEGQYIFREGSTYELYVGNGGVVGNRQNGALNKYGGNQCGQPSFINAVEYSDLKLAPGGLYGGGGINGYALNIDGIFDFPGGSSGGGMAYNYPANVYMNTASGQLTKYRIGSAYTGGSGKIISYKGNAGNGGGGGGAGGAGGVADDKYGGDGGNGLRPPYWLKGNPFMDDNWKTATENGTIVAGGGGGGAWSQFLCVPGKGGRGGGGNGGGCIYSRGTSGLPPDYNKNDLSSTLNVTSCTAPPSNYVPQKHLDNIVGFEGKPGAPNTGSGGGGGSSTGFVGGDGGSGLLVLRIRIGDENTKGMNQCKWSYSENPGADATCPSFAQYCNGFIEGRSWGTCSADQSVMNAISPKPITYLPLRNSFQNLGTEQREVQKRGNVGFVNLYGVQCVFFYNSLNNFLFVDHVPYDFTFAFWLYVADNGGYTAVSYGALNFGNVDNPSIQCDFNGGQHVGFHAALPRRWRSIGKNYAFVKRWTHFAYTVNQSNYETKLYIDGNLQGETRGEGRLGNPSYHFILGRSGDNYRAYYGGMHDFIVYNSILTPSEIARVYKATMM